MTEKNWGSKAKELVSKIEVEGNVSEGKRPEASTNLAIAYALLAILEKLKKQNG